MKQEYKETWLKKLRSGRYKQAQENLKADGGYCCLGVLRTCFPKGPLQTGQDDEAEWLNKEQLKEAGLTHASQKFLSKVNDGEVDEPWDFKKIADWIEKKY
jgi:hypothetical protein